MVTEVRCSSLSRVMGCLGVLKLTDLEVVEAGQPAKDGTACGELLSHMITQGTITPALSTRHASNGVIWDNDMWFYAKEVYQNILEAAQGNKVETEERIDWMTSSGIKIRGQFDISFIVGDTLFVEDLKYGWGLVEVVNNWQLIGYAIGNYIRLHGLGLANDVKKVSMTIHQPRPYHPDGRTRNVVITTEELMGYYNQICERMQRYVDGDTTATTGNQCRYCEGRNNCPALNATLYKSVETVMKDWEQDTMRNEEVARELVLLDRVKDVLKLKLDSLNQLAILRMQANQVVPGYAYEMTYGDRKWKAGVTVKSIEAFCGKKLESAPTLLSPNQAEKNGLSKKIVAQLTYVSSAGAKVVKKDLAAEAKKTFTKPEEV